MASNHPVIRRITNADEIHISTLIERVLVMVRRGGREFLEYSFDFIDIEDLGFVYFEFLEEGEERQFLIGSLCVAGRVMERRLGCSWGQLWVDGRMEYVQCHSAFPEPLILSRLFEYCLSRDVDFETDYLHDCPGALYLIEKALDSIRERIEVYELRRSVESSKLSHWRYEHPLLRFDTEGLMPG